MNKASQKLKNGAQCKVLVGTHTGKAGMVRDKLRFAFRMLPFCKVIMQKNCTGQKIISIFSNNISLLY